MAIPPLPPTPPVPSAPALPLLTVEQELALIITELAEAPVQRENLQIQQMKQQIRQNLVQTMLKKLELPEHTLWKSTRQSLALGQHDGIQFEIATQCFLLGFFDDLVRRCHLPAKVIEQIMGLLNFLNTAPFVKDNGKRLKDILNYLKEFIVLH